jgi:hypothetical protein
MILLEIMNCLLKKICHGIHRLEVLEAAARMACITAIWVLILDDEQLKGIDKLFML